MSYSDELTTAWLTFRFYLSEIKRHERDAAAYLDNPNQTWLENSAAYIGLAKYRAAKWLVRFIRLVREVDGFVSVNRHVYVDTA